MRELSPWPSQHSPQPANMQPEYMSAPESEEPSLRDYWKMLRKRRRLVFLVFLTFIGLGTFVTIWWTPQYTAVTTLKIDPGNPSVADTVPHEDDYLPTQVALLKPSLLHGRT